MYCIFIKWSLLLSFWSCLELKRGEHFFRGFSDYMSNGVEAAYQQLCGEITQEFNDCSKQVLISAFFFHFFFVLLMYIEDSFCMGNVKQVIDLESMLMLPDVRRADLANLLKAVQAQEKQKLHLVSCFIRGYACQ